PRSRWSRFIIVFQLGTPLQSVPLSRRLTFRTMSYLAEPPDEGETPQEEAERAVKHEADRRGAAIHQYEELRLLLVEVVTQLIADNRNVAENVGRAYQVATEKPKEARQDGQERCLRARRTHQGKPHAEDRIGAEDHDKGDDHDDHVEDVNAAEDYAVEPDQGEQQEQGTP